MKPRMILLPVGRCDGWSSTKDGVPAAHPPHVYDWEPDRVLRFCHGEGGFE